MLGCRHPPSRAMRTTPAATCTEDGLDGWFVRSMTFDAMWPDFGPRRATSSLTQATSSRERMSRPARPVGVRHADPSTHALMANGLAGLAVALRRVSALGGIRVMLAFFLPLRSRWHPPQRRHSGRRVPRQSHLHDQLDLRRDAVVHGRVSRPGAPTTPTASGLRMVRVGRLHIRWNRRPANLSNVSSLITVGTLQMVLGGTGSFTWPVPPYTGALFRLTIPNAFTIGFQYSDPTVLSYNCCEGFPTWRPIARAAAPPECPCRYSGYVAVGSFPSSPRRCHPASTFRAHRPLAGAIDVRTHGRGAAGTRSRGAPTAYVTARVAMSQSNRFSCSSSSRQR